MNNYQIINNIEDYIDDIIKLDDIFYDKQYIWSNEYQLEVYKRNKDSFIAVKLNDDLVGYLNYLCITEDAYKRINNSNVTVDEFDLNDIVEYKEGNNYITINSVVIKKEYQDADVIKIITNGLLDKLKTLEETNKHIAGIDGIAISQDGRKFLSNLGLNVTKELDDGNLLLSLDENVVSCIEEKINELKK